MNEKIGVFEIRQRDGTKRAYEVWLMRAGESEPCLKIRSAEACKGANGKEWEECATVLFRHGHIQELGAHDCGISCAFLPSEDSGGRLIAGDQTNAFELRELREKARKLETVREAARITTEASI